MKNYNDVLINPEKYILTDIEKRYIELYSTNENNNKNRERIEREEFRKNCINRYKKCIISNVFSGECDACHIIPYGKGLDNINNSLLLTKSLHNLFDEGYWTIHYITGKIIISDEILNEETSIHKYLDIDLKYILNKELSNNLKWHYNNIFISS